jgi:hypothetical protein
MFVIAKVLKFKAGSCEYMHLGCLKQWMVNKI